MAAFAKISDGDNDAVKMVVCDASASDLVPDEISGDGVVLASEEIPPLLKPKINIFSISHSRRKPRARKQLLQLIMTSSSTTAMHAAMSFLNFVLLALLQLKYQNKKTSPFEAHGTIMLLYILTSIIYSTAVIALLLRAHHQLPETPCLAALEHISLLSGALACGLLLLILAPPSGYFLLACCGVLVLVKALLGSYQQIVGHLLDVAAISERARDLILKVFHRSGRQEARDQAHAMVSQSMNRVPTDHNSTDQGSGDHGTTPSGGV